MPGRNKWEKIIAVSFLLILLLIPNLARALIFPSGIIHFVKEFQEDATDPSPAEASDAIHQVRVIKKEAVLRLKPKSDSVILRKLPLGALLDVQEQLDDWLKLSLPPDKDGFVVTGYLHESFTEPSSIIHK